MTTEPRRAVGGSLFLGRVIHNLWQQAPLARGISQPLDPNFLNAKIFENPASRATSGAPPLRKLFRLHRTVHLSRVFFKADIYIKKLTNFRIFHILPAQKNRGLSRVRIYLPIVEPALKIAIENDICFHTEFSGNLKGHRREIAVHQGGRGCRGEASVVSGSWWHS